MALRNKSFGQAQEFVWSHDSSQYATREGSSTVQIFKNFKEQKSFKPDFGAEGRSLYRSEITFFPSMLRAIYQSVQFAQCAAQFQNHIFTIYSLLT